LREREEDIPLLVQHFVRKFALRLGKPIDYIPDEVIEALKSYHWPGNIRELQNFIERSVIMTTGRVLYPSLAELELPTKEAAFAPVRTLADAERAHISDAARSQLDRRWTWWRGRQTGFTADHPHFQDAKTWNFARKPRTRGRRTAFESRGSVQHRFADVEWTSRRG